MVQIWHVTLDTMAFLEWKCKPLFFLIFSLFIFFNVFVFIILCNLFWALFLTQNLIVSLVLFSKRWANFAFGYSNVQENEQYNLCSFVFQKTLLFSPEIWCTGFVHISFSWSTLKPAMMLLVCAVAYSMAWLSPWMFHLCFFMKYKFSWEK